MSSKLPNGQKAKTDENRSLKTLSKTWALTLTAHDLLHEGVIEIVGNSQMRAGGPVGVIIFIPGATVGENDLIDFPQLPTLAKPDNTLQIANAGPAKAPKIANGPGDPEVIS